MPPWKEIYKTDGERKQTWEEVVYILDKMKETYLEYGYEVIELPKDTVENTRIFIQDLIHNIPKQKLKDDRTLNKEELLQAINTNYEKLKKELSSIPHELTTAKKLEGHSKGTLMSINNLFAYLVGRGELVLKWNNRIDHNETIDFPETGFKWNELGRLAQKFYEDYKDDDFITLQSKLDNTVDAVLSLIESKSNQELMKFHGTGNGHWVG